MMDFNQAIRDLNELLSQQQPGKINSSWISKKAPRIYRFIWKNIRNEIGDIDWDIAFVRISQKGNLLAIKEIILLLRYAVDSWIEYCYQLRSWKGYESEIEEQLEACIRRYRFTGSFIVYLFRTLEYRGRGLKFLHSYSLDSKMFFGESRMVENVVKDPETNEIRMYRPY